MTRARPAPEATSRARPAPEATSRARPAPEARSRARLLAAVSGAALVAALVLGPAAPADAATANIAFSGPAPSQVFASGVTSVGVAITGTANLTQAPLWTNTVTDVQVAVTYGSSVVYSCAHAGDCGATSGQPSTSFSFTPVFTRNGPYSATAVATGTECLLGCTLRSSSASVNFSVGVHPAPPRNVTARVNGNRSVTISWAPNPEPDIIGYQILRAGPGGSRVVNPFLQATSWTDSGTTTTGGDYGYTVVAFRPGADGTATSSTVLSASSAAATANVPDPPAPTTTIGPGGPVVVTTTTVAPAPPAAPDLSGFLNQATQAGAIPPVPPPSKPVVHAAPAPAPRVAVPAASGSVAAALGPPDTYAPTLPYTAKAPAAAASGSGAPQVPLGGRPLPAHHGRSLLVPIAGGLLLCVLGLALRNANHRPGPEPLEPIAEGERPPAGPTGGVSVFPASVAAKATSRAPARPSTDEAVDYFRLVPAAPPADDPDTIEAGAPTA